MVASTKIEWADSVFNPVTGCTPISPGCANCYAKRMSRRLAGRCGYPKDEPFRVTLHPEKLEEPLHWKKPRRVFVCSMGDLFHNDVPTDFLVNVFAVMSLTPQHTFMLLTKRPKAMAELMRDNFHEEVWYARDMLIDKGIVPYTLWKHMEYWEQQDDLDVGVPVRTMFSYEPAPEWPLPNVWLGVTAENQQTADKRIPILLQTPAAVHFVSVEPMLGPVRLQHCWKCKGPDIEGCLCEQDFYGSVDWVICGGETGPGARPVHPDWVRGLRNQCQAAGVPFFFKSWGEWHESDLQSNSRGWQTHLWPDGKLMYRMGRKKAGRLLDGRTWEEYPKEV